MEVAKLKRELQREKDKSKLGWAKYYQETRWSHTALFETLNIIKNIKEQVNNDDYEIPLHIVTEINTLYKDQKKKIECPICLEDLEEFALSKCGHKYCDPCLKKLIDTSNKCGICRKQLKYKK